VYCVIGYYIEIKKRTKVCDSMLHTLTVLFCVLRVCKRVLDYSHRDIGALFGYFPRFIRSCKANARVQLAKTGHGQHFPIYFHYYSYVCCTLKMETVTTSGESVLFTNRHGVTSHNTRIYITNVCEKFRSGLLQYEPSQIGCRNDHIYRPATLNVLRFPAEASILFSKFSRRVPGPSQPSCSMRN
jgi:hypothetical protein